MQVIERHKPRGHFRKIIGKNYYILKRKWLWITASQNFANQRTPEILPFSHIQHQSLLLRPLKDVEMQLQHNKITNLRLATAKINNIVIKPGETFSVWKLIGKPSAKKGYLNGLVLQNGQISKGIGGGLCQLGNLIYWMALHTPLTIKERYRHSYDVFPDVNRTIPFACGATLSYNYIDLQLQNNTSSEFQINVSVGDEYLHGEIRSNAPVEMKYKVFETDHCFKQQYWGGYTRHNRIWKRIYSLENVVMAEELVSENHAIMMYNPLLTN